MIFSDWCSSCIPVARRGALAAGRPKLQLWRDSSHHALGEPHAAHTIDSSTLGHNQERPSRQPYGCLSPLIRYGRPDGDRWLPATRAETKEANAPARPALPEGLQLLPGEVQLAVGGSAAGLRCRIRGPAGFRQLAMCLRQLALRVRQLAAQPAAQQRAARRSGGCRTCPWRGTCRAFRPRRGRLPSQLHDAGSSLCHQGCRQPVPVCTMIASGLL